MMDDRKRKTGGEVELLPLPIGKPAHSIPDGREVFGYVEVEAYARANVDRALAASRAEVAEWKASYQQAADAGAAHADRAERLAGALRDALECGNDGDWQSARNAINTALNLEPRND